MELSLLKNDNLSVIYLFFDTFVKPPFDEISKPMIFWAIILKRLSHEIDFKNFDKNLQNLA